MTRVGFAVLAGAMLAAAAATQVQANPQTTATSSPSAQAEAAAASLPGGTTVNVQLNSSVDSKKAKVGDKVEAHTTEAIKYGGKIIVPQGAKLEGHVIQATARSKGDRESILAIQFDKAIPKKGEEIPLTVAIQAVAAPQNDFGGSAGPGSDPMAGVGASAAGGSPMGASRPQNPNGAIPNSPAGEAAGSQGSNGSTLLSATSRGVYGLNDLKLMQASPNGIETTVITSSGKNVHLDSGTRLLLIAQAQTAAASNK